MPEIGMEISKIETQNLPTEKEAELKEELFREFGIKSGTHSYAQSTFKSLCPL